MSTPLVIVAGKTYLTRGGKKVKILMIDAKHDAYPVIGLLTRHDGKEVPVVFTAKGTYVTDGSIYDQDIVKEYVEPPKPREAWILCGPEGIGSLSYESETEAYDLGGGDGTEVAILFREVLPE